MPGDDPLTRVVDAVPVPHGGEEPSGVGRPRRSQRRPRRVWLHRVVVALTVLTALAVVATAVPLAYVHWRDGQVTRVPGLKKALAKSAAPGLPFNILLVGSDTRADITGAETKSFGDAEQVKGQRSDTMMVVHLDPGTGRVSVLSIPRDLYVSVVGLERKERINKAFDSDYGGGPERLVQTIQRELGIQVNHYAEVDFVGFRGVVKAVGGVPVWVPYPARDRVTGLDLAGSGCLMLTPDQALAYVRSRHFQEYRNGRWRTDPTSDFGRIERQQGFMRHTLRRAIAKGARNPVVLNRLVDSAVKSVTLDDGFSSRDIARIARRFRSLAPEAIQTFVLPVEPAVINRADVLLLDKAKAQDTINQFNGFPPAPPLTPDKVTVVLRDAGGAQTAAAMAAAAERFTTLGFRLADSPARAGSSASSSAAGARRTTVPTDGSDTTVPESGATDLAVPDTTLFERAGEGAPDTTADPGVTDTRVGGDSDTTVAGASRPARRTTSTRAAGPVATELRTVVRHRPQTLDKGQLVASYVIGGAKLVEDPTLMVDVVVELGRNWRGLRSAPLAAVGPVTPDDAAAHACA